MEQIQFKDTLLLTELAEYLRLPPPAVEGLAERGLFPGERPGGRWRFRRSEVDRWLDLGMAGWDASVHPMLGGTHEQGPAMLGNALRPANVLLDLKASDLAECLERAVARFELPSGTDRTALVSAIWERERMCSTALDHGFALPHTRRTGPRLVTSDVVGLVRLRTPVPASDAKGALVDLLFFVFAREPATHLRLLARATRLAQETSLAGVLRAARQPGGVIRAIVEAERRLFPQPTTTEGARVAGAMLWDRLQVTYAAICADWEAGRKRGDPIATAVARLVRSELDRGASHAAPSTTETTAHARVRAYAVRAFEVLAAQRRCPIPTALVFDRVRQSLEDAGFNRDLSWRLCLGLRDAGVVAGEPNRPYLDRRAQRLVERLLVELGLRTRLVKDLEAGLMIAAEPRLATAGPRLDAEVLTEACSRLAKESADLLTAKPQT